MPEGLQPDQRHLVRLHKPPLRTYLLATTIFVNEVKGKSMLALSRDLDVQCKTAFVLAHKLREAIRAEIKANRLGGEGKVAEIDGAYFGGYVKQENRKEDRKNRRLKENQSDKRQCAVVIRERDHRTVTKTFKSEDESLSFIKANLGKGITLHADKSVS